MKNIFLSIFVSLMLIGCAKQETTIISTNNFRQTDYNYQCLTSDKTFTQIIICYQTQDNSEKIQNKVTNDLIDKKTAN